VDNSALKLRPGMTADVSFVVEALPDALLVPNAALRFRPPGAEPAPAGGAQGGVAARSGGARGGRPAGQGGAAPGATPGAARAGEPGAAGGGEGGPARAGAAPGGGSSAGGGVAPDGPRRGRRAVWVLAADGALRQVAVQVGPSDGKNTAILAGELAEGDRVVVGTSGGEPPAAPRAQQPPPMGRFL